MPVLLLIIGRIFLSVSLLSLRKIQILLRTGAHSGFLPTGTLSRLSVTPAAASAQ